MASSWGTSWSPSWGDSWGTLVPPAPNTPAWLETWGRSWADSWGLVEFEEAEPATVVDRLNLVSPADLNDDPTLVPRIYEMLEMTLDGRTRNSVEVTLTANASSTTVDVPRFESHQIPVLVPLSAAAAAELAAGTAYVSARTAGQFTITHANNSSTSRTFGCIFVG